MKKSLPRVALRWFTFALAIGWISGCDEKIVVPNLVMGARDGSVSAATGIIESFFDQKFGTNDVSEESGDGLFILP